jgi:hypothetical protein
MTLSRSVRRLGAMLVLVPLAGCAVAGHTSSPWQWGGTLRPAPGLWSLGQGDATVHPMVGYTYLSFDGGNNQLFEFGPQLRFPMGQAERPFWVGGEATVSLVRTKFDGAPGTSTNNGWTITGLAGMPFGDSRWGPSVFGGVGISDYGAQGWNVRFGIDLQPTFLWSN